MTISDESKGFSRTTTSDGQGNYRLLLLPPGTYTVKATAAGFNTLVSKNVVLTTGEQGELALSLAVGTTQIVTVSSGADIIETRAHLSVHYSRPGSNCKSADKRTQLYQLHPYQFADRSRRCAFDGRHPHLGLNFGGVRARSNSINVDGADASDYLSGGTRATVSQDAVQEFQIITNGFAAEYGRASGGVVNIITKSGTNTTHA